MKEVVKFLRQGLTGFLLIQVWEHAHWSVAICFIFIALRHEAEEWAASKK